MAASGVSLGRSGGTTFQVVSSTWLYNEQNDFLQDLEAEAAPQTILGCRVFDSNVEDIRDARVIFLGDTHSSKPSTRAQIDIIKKYISDGDIILLEGCERFSEVTRAESRLLEAIPDKLFTCKAYGWDDMKLVSRGRTILEVYKILDNILCERLVPSGRGSDCVEQYHEKLFKEAMALASNKRNRKMLEVIDSMMRTAAPGAKIFVRVGEGHFAKLSEERLNFPYAMLIPLNDDDKGENEEKIFSEREKNFSKAMQAFLQRPHRYVCVINPACSCDEVKVEASCVRIKKYVKPSVGPLGSPAYIDEQCAKEHGVLDSYKKAGLIGVPLIIVRTGD